MAGWTNDELDRIGAAEDLRIAGLRSDDTLRNPVTIWVVRVSDDIYVRSVNGRDSAWFCGVLTRHEGRIWTGGIENDVTFIEEGRDLDQQIDAAYSAKYRRYHSSVEHINSRQAREALVKLVPR